MTDLTTYSALELAKLVRTRQVSAEEILNASLARIEEVDGRPGTLDAKATPEDEKKVHAFITHTEEIARKQAQEVDTKIAQGQDAGLLAGVPFTVKDIFCVRGTPSTAASRILSNFIAPYTATPVERMMAAGGLMLGKMNLDEFTYGSSSESSAFQPSPRNPWNLSKVPGGSSGGSAAAVAAGEGALTLGTDTAGSIRQPAAFCGVVGMKPTYGRVSRYGLIAFGSSLDCPGPIARTVKDAALMLQVIAGADKADSTATIKAVPDYLKDIEKGVAGMRIGLSPDLFSHHLFLTQKVGNISNRLYHKKCKMRFNKAAQVYREMGAEIIEDVPMPNTRFGIPIYFVISRVEAASNLHRFDGVKYGYRTKQAVTDLKEMYRRSRGEGFGLQPKLRILMGMYVSAAQYSEQYYQRALKARTLMRRDFENAFDPNGKYKLNALLTPTTPTTAFGMADVYGDSVMMQYADQFTVPANHAGVPGISIPAGFSKDGLPIGIQLLGADFSEASLLRIARSYEMTTENEEWRKKKPAVLEGK